MITTNIIIFVRDDIYEVEALRAGKRAERSRFFHHTVVREATRHTCAASSRQQSSE